MKKLTNHSTYFGEVGIDPRDGAWTTSDNFNLDVLQQFENDLESLSAPFLEYEHDVYLFSLRESPMDSDRPMKEWQVYRKGVWMDSVYFDSTMSSDEVRESLVIEDSYPDDIVLISTK